MECRSIAVRLGLASHNCDAAASPTPHLPMRSSLSPAPPRARTWLGLGLGLGFGLGLGLGLVYSSVCRFSLGMAAC